MSDFEQACVVPYFDHKSTVPHPSLEEERALNEAARSASEVVCSTLIEQLAAIAHKTPEARLALHLARAWLGQHGESREARCNEIQLFAEELTGHPEALFQLALCIDADIQHITTLFQQVLEIDPGHHDALDFLISLVLHADEAYGIDSETLLRHASALYEVGRLVRHKVSAAVLIFQLSNQAGDREASKAIRDRLRRDVGLDVLDYDPARRAGSLRRVCSRPIFELGLESLCLSAVETLVWEALADGVPIPSDVLWHVEHVYEEFRYAPVEADPKTNAAGHLKALLDVYPASLRSSEHYRVHADTASTWGDRISLLRRAVELDYANLQARCDLAEALVVTGERDEAGQLYLDLTSEWAPCSSEEALRSLEEQTLLGTDPPVTSPEDPVKFLILR